MDILLYAVKLIIACLIISPFAVAVFKTVVDRYFEILGKALESTFGNLGKSDAHPDGNCPGSDEK